MSLFKPLGRYEDIIGDFRELAQDFLPEQVFGAIPHAVKLKIVKLSRHLFGRDACAPILQLVLKPFKIDLPGDDYLPLNDVRG